MALAKRKYSTGIIYYAACIKLYLAENLPPHSDIYAGCINYLSRMECDTIVILLGGGTKKRQSRDIKIAKGHCEGMSLLLSAFRQHEGIKLHVKAQCVA